MESIIIASKDDLLGAVTEAVKTALILTLPSALERATTKPYLTKKELMELTGWSSRQIEYKKSSRAFPFIKRGRLILFPTKDVYEYLDEAIVPSARKAFEKKNNG